MKLSSVKIDSARLEQGDWISDIPDLPGVKLRVRGIGNNDYRRLQSKLINDVPRNDRLNGLSPEQQDRIQGECLAKTVLLGWEGLEEEDGSPLAYSSTRAAEILADPDFAVFRSGVVFAAGRLADDRDETTKELAGN